MARSPRPVRSRAEARLDPIRWRRPGRGALLRLGVIAALLTTAAFLTWAGPQTCALPGDVSTTLGADPERRGETASATSSAGRTPQPQPGGSTAREGAGGAMERSDGRAVVPAGRVGVPVRLAEATALTLVRPGDHVDLIRVGGESRETSAIAAAALVLGVTGADDPTTGGLLIALTPAEAAKAVAEPGRGFAVLIRP